MALAFRVATAADTETIHALIRAAFCEYAGSLAVTPGALMEGAEEVRKAVAEERVVLACDADGAIVGTARQQIIDGSFWVGRVAVHPDHRRRGIGRALMLEMERIARSLGCARVRLSTRGSMPANLAFYAELGYRIIGTEPHPRGPDTIVHFEKTLTRG